MTDTQDETKPEQQVESADIIKKRRSRSGVIGYVNKLLNGDVAKFRRAYDDGHLNNLVSLRDVIEEKIKKVVQLSDEIQDTLNDVDFHADFDKYTDIEVTLRCELTDLTKFIEQKRRKLVPSNVSSSESKVKLPKFEIKNLMAILLTGNHSSSRLTWQFMKIRD